MKEMENNKHLYWKHFKMWIIGILISFPITATLGYLSKEINSKFITPVLAAILFFPVVVISLYGFTHNFCASYKYGYIYRGKKAKISNTFALICYGGMVLMSAFMS